MSAGSEAGVVAVAESLVKIIATLGPSSGKPDVVLDLAFAGVDAFRINFSHGDEEQWQRYVGLILEVEGKVGKPMGIIGDLEGPRVRIAAEKPVLVRPGDTLIFTYKTQSEEKAIPVDSKAFFSILDPGDLVFIDDGRVVLQVESVKGTKAELRVVEGDLIAPRKGVVVSGKEYPLPYITEKDKKDLAFAVSNKFSHILVSFARDAHHIAAVKGFVERLGGKNVKILAKIETPSGVRKVKEILDEADGVVVARGDLGMHFPLEEVPRIQEEIVRAAKSKYKPVVVATQLLSSMIEHPTPTRSEVMDVYSAVKMGVDALMLTSETAVGKYPVHAVAWITRIASKALGEVEPQRPHAKGILHRLARGVVELAENLGAPILAYSMSGGIAWRIAAFRPLRPVHVGVPKAEIARTLTILWSIHPHVVEASNREEGLEKLYEKLTHEEVIGVGDIIVEASWSLQEGVHTIRVKHIYP